MERAGMDTRKRVRKLLNVLWMMFFLFAGHALAATDYASVRELKECAAAGEAVTLSCQLKIVGAITDGMCVVTDGADFIPLSFDPLNKDRVVPGAVLPSFTGTYCTDDSYPVVSNGKEEYVLNVDPALTGPAVPAPTVIGSGNKLSKAVLYVRKKGKFKSGTNGYTISADKIPLKGRLVNVDNLTDLVNAESVTVVGVVGFSYGEPLYISETAISTEEEAVITVSSEPPGGGKAWIGDDRSAAQTRRPLGDNVHLTALPSPGYLFKGWMRGDVELSCAPEINDAAGNGSCYTAVFVQGEGFPVEVTATGEGSISARINDQPVDNPGSFEAPFGAELALVAAAEPGWRFVGWRSGGATVSTEEEYRFTCAGACVLEAVFEKIEATSLSALSEDWEGLSQSAEVAVSGEYEVVCVAADKVFLADASTDRTLKCSYGAAVSPALWNVGSVLTDLTLRLGVNGGGEREAFFVRAPRVVREGDGIPAKTPREVTPDALVAEAASGDGAFVALSDVTLTRTADSAVEFEIGGSSSRAGERVVAYCEGMSGTQIPEGSLWDISGVISRIPTQLARKALVVTSAARSGEERKVKVSVSATDGGKAWVGDDRDCQAKEWFAGHPLTVHALAEEGRSFLGWRAGPESEAYVSTSADYTLSPTVSTALTAVFSAPQPPVRTVRVSSGRPEIGAVAIEGTDALEITTAADVAVRATPVGEHSFFVDWRDGDGRLFSTEPAAEYTGETDISLTAAFIRRFPVEVRAPGTVTAVLTAGSPAGELSPGSRVDEGTAVTLTVAVAKGRRISRIAVNDVTVGVSEGTYSLTADRPLEIVITDAVDESNRFVLGVLSSDPSMGTAYIGIPGVATMAIGYHGEALCVAEPAEDCVFEGWSAAGPQGAVTYRDNPLKIGGMSFDVTLTAIFSPKIRAGRRVTVETGNPEKGRVSIEGADAASIVSRRYVTVRAVPLGPDDYFVDWTDGTGKVVGNEPEYRYTGEGDVTLRAAFVSRYRVECSAEGRGSVAVAGPDGAPVSPETLIDEGMRLTVETLPEENYRLESLTLNGQEAEPDSDGRCQFALGAHTQVRARFRGVDHTLTLKEPEDGTLRAFTAADASGSPAGSELGDGSYIEHGTILHVFVTAPEGHVIEGVAVNGTVLQTDADGHLAVEVKGDVALELRVAKPTGIEGIADAQVGATTEAVWDLKGHYIGRRLPSAPGVYILRLSGRPKPVKVLVR